MRKQETAPQYRLRQYLAKECCEFACEETFLADAAAYCLDAPTLMPAGSMRGMVGSTPISSRVDRN